MEVPKGREAGEIGGNYATLHNISQSKKGKREEAKKKVASHAVVFRGVVLPSSPQTPAYPSLTFLSYCFTRETI